MNDECAQATLVGQGPHPFDTRSGTASAEPLQCSASTVGSSDVWLTYEAVTTGFDLQVCLDSVDFTSRS